MRKPHYIYVQNEALSLVVGLEWQRFDAAASQLARANVISGDWRSILDAAMSNAEPDDLNDDLPGMVDMGDLRLAWSRTADLDDVEATDG